MTDQQDGLLEQMEKLHSVVITVRAELDQTTLTFAELLDLDVGSLITLSRPTGEHIDIYAEEALIGWGEVLLMDGTMSVRLADLRNARAPGLLEEDEVEMKSAVGHGE